MGGHGHDVAHHHGPPKDPYRVPKPDECINIPNESPYLIKLQNRLAKHGLKDPWMRNYAWKYNKKFGTPLSRAGRIIFKGVPTGLAAFLITIGVETYLGVDYHPWHHEHGDGDGGHGDH